MILTFLYLFFSIFNNIKTYEIDLQGNAWSKNTESKNWSGEPLDIYFYATDEGLIELDIEVNVLRNAEILAEMDGQKKKIFVRQNTTKIDFGKFKVNKNGYKKLRLTSKDNIQLELGKLKIHSPFEVYYAKDDFYWSKRGPSVHLRYTIPEDKNIKFLYNEITVPKGNDVVGSYFMANGFAEGYFGIQVNSETERRILFSVWSPFVTDNPNEIPDDQKIQVLQRGNNVKIGEFGNEGSGGQSYKVFNWKAGNTYKFLTKIEPSKVSGSTEYTSYFWAPETQQWELIASFRRPKTYTYAKRFHSFLENFIPSQGNITREVHYSNPWVMDINNQWYEVTEAKFSVDETGRKKNRLDYAGGLYKNSFVLKNCGFFDYSTVIGSIFEREKYSKKPDINIKI